MTYTNHLAGALPDAIDPVAFEILRARARQEVEAALLPSAQFALAYRGQLIAFETFGAASNQSLYPIFSATKAITSALSWLSLQTGALTLEAPVSNWIPAFKEGDKSLVTVLHLLTHTAGFPNAPFRPTDYFDVERRQARFRQWRLEWPPGSRFVYHPTSSLWALAEILEQIHGQGIAELIKTEIAEPLGLPELFVGCPSSEHNKIAPVSHAGAAPSAQDYADLNLQPPPVSEVTEAAIDNFNTAEIRAVPIPGGGGFMTAATLALFYQGLLGYSGNSSDFAQVPWQAETLLNARAIRTHGLKDPYLGFDVLRGLGIVIAGDKDQSLRGFGHGSAPTSFGHGGAGGQIAWADPVSGLSFVYLTNGHDRNPFRQGRRGVSLSSKAVNCLRA
ncbi:MAG: beta-lactamase family protein [Gammaproteobacteria bacterium]|jgi:CubicO group peptidase (beta-lactamase class C family)|nr:beta-lactamase family protein [Gammaproteobacteria bacterium]MBT5054071.1 beta-lactamase family protein [Gammaproteobacteria bacterium]